MTKLNTWNEQPDPETLAYHLRQWQEPYRSTVKFAEFIHERMPQARSVVDVGCGAGAATCFLAHMFPTAGFAGIDVSAKLIELAINRSNAVNLKYVVADACNLGTPGNVDAVISLQTLSWMPNYERPLDEICNKLHPRWLAFSSLIYEGDIDCAIVVKEHQRPRQSYYNVYGLPGIRRFLRAFGYTLAEFEPFTLDKQLLKPQDPDLMQTWTQGGRQFSGPLYLPWAFAMFERR